MLSDECQLVVPVTNRRLQSSDTCDCTVYRDRSAWQVFRCCCRSSDVKHAHILILDAVIKVSYSLIYLLPAGAAEQTILVGPSKERDNHKNVPFLRSKFINNFEGSTLQRYVLSGIICSQGLCKKVGIQPIS